MSEWRIVLHKSVNGNVWIVITTVYVKVLFTVVNVKDIFTHSSVKSVIASV